MMKKTGRLILPVFLFLIRRQRRVNPHRPVVSKYDHARLGSRRLFNVFNRYVVHRHVFRGAGLAVVCGNGGCFEYGFFIKLLTAALHYDMGTGDVFCVQP